MLTKGNFLLRLFAITCYFFFCIYVSEARAAQNQEHVKLLDSGAWSALAANSNDKKTRQCIAISIPTKKEPQNLDHGEVYLFIVTRQEGGAKDQPGLRVGFNFKKSSDITITIDGQKFVLFPADNIAWVESVEDEAKLVRAIKAGKTLSVGAVSGRGNKVTYEFQLTGASAAIDRAAEHCRK